MNELFFQFARIEMQDVGEGKQNLISADQWVASFEAKTIGTTISGLYFDILNYVKTGRKWLDKQTTVEKIILYPYFNMSDVGFVLIQSSTPSLLSSFFISIRSFGFYMAFSRSYNRLPLL
ncbi:Hypothetical predicted protein [Octopus vulgaris]|uniref:Uncharacterized protein n=1 Tax=Octopus vulgaris TaxID=6645 RepID=A0AA36FFJ2_OCTVU|nr:Hypothetical predicted protein [Octopus vulgaris]